MYATLFMDTAGEVQILVFLSKIDTYNKEQIGLEYRLPGPMLLGLP